MIVTCSECTTSFQLDESRIPASGARVRCSRCKHAFFLPNPSASQSQAADAIAENAAQDAAAGVPPVSNDLAGLDGSIASEVNPAEPQPDSAVEAQAELDDEDDWQFTEEIRVEGDDESDDDSGDHGDFGVETDFSAGFDGAALGGDASEEIGDSGLDLDSSFSADAGAVAGLEADPNEESSGLDLGVAGGTIGEPEPDDEAGLPPSSESESSDPTSSFGEVEDFSALTEDVGMGVEESASKLNDDLSDDSDAGVYHASGQSDVLAEPESWDLAPNADFDSSKASIAGLVGTFAPSQASDLASSGIFDGEVDPSDFDTEARRGSKLIAALAAVGSGIGWVVTLAVIAYVGYLNLESEWNRWEIGPQTVTVGSFAAETTATRWVESARAGMVLVIDGTARNTGRQPIVPPLLRVALLDGQGVRIAGGDMLAGSPLTEVTLREGSAGELERLSMLAPDRFRMEPMTPGESRAFQVVVSDLPDEAGRYLLESVEATLEQQPGAPSAVHHATPEARSAESAVPDFEVDSNGNPIVGIDSPAAAPSRELEGSAAGPADGVPTPSVESGEAR